MPETHAAPSWSLETRLALSLFLLRLGVFVVMVMWALDKLLNPGHAAAVWENFYLIGGLAPVFLAFVGVAQLLLLLAFLAGVAKRWTYGAVLLLHGVSTLSSWKQYLGFDSLLFFAAWPMLAACVALYLLRDQDRLLTLPRDR